MSKVIYYYKQSKNRGRKMKKIALMLLGTVLSMSCLNAGNITIKINDLRTDKSKAVNIQPDKSFLYQDQGLSTIVPPNVSTPLSSYSSNSYTFYAAQTPANGGLRLYFSIGTALPAGPDHSFIDPDVANIRFDWIEATFDGSASACANLTSLEQLGICLSLESFKGGAKVGSVGWKTSLVDIVNKIRTTPSFPIKSVKGIPGTDFVRIIGAQKPWQGSYLWGSSMNNSFAAVAKKAIQINNFFAGSTDASGVTHKGGIFKLTGTFDATGKKIVLGGTFEELDKTITNITMKVENITIASIFGAVVAKSISDGCTLACTKNGNPVTRKPNNNDLWACIFNYLVTGFNAGFWTNPNTLNTLEWNVQEEFKGSSYNQYSALIHFNSNSYGDPFSDNVPGNNVQLNLAPEAVDTMVISILDDKTPSGYSVPSGTSILPGYQISCSKTTPALKGIIFNDDKANVMVAKDNIIFFPSTIKNGDKNVKLSFVYESGNKPDEKDYPYINIDMPASPLDSPPAATTINTQYWRINNTPALPGAIASWQSNISAIFMNLTLSSNIIPTNFATKIPISATYQITSGAPGLDSVIFVQGGTPVTIDSSSKIAPFSNSMKTGAYNKMSFPFNGASKPYPYIWLYLSADKTVKPTIDCKGWSLKGGVDGQGIFFTWNKLPVAAGGQWNLALSANLKPANFHSKKADKTPPTVPPEVGAQDI